MFLPVALWLCLRFAFFGGVGGTYVMAGYTPLAHLALSLKKLRYLDILFVAQYPPTGYQDILFGSQYHAADSVNTYPALLNRAIRIGTRLLIYALLCLWALGVLRETVNYLRARHQRRWPTVDARFLVALWGCIAIGFHFALPLFPERYATSVVVFTWPAIVAEVERRRNTVLWLGLALCCIVSLARASQYSIEFLSLTKSRENNYRSIEAALRQTPKAIQQVYILAAVDAQPFANPEYMRRILGVPAEIVRIIDLNWNCGESNNSVLFNHSIANGVVTLTVALPACANFIFLVPIRDEALANGQLYRNATMSYELPEAYPKEKWLLEVGRTITVHIHPSGPARFIIQHGGPNGIAWFDTP
jgi:hypothetical protein